MKNATLLFVINALFFSVVWAQNIETFDRISPFHNGLAAVQNNGQWGFIDTKGELVVAYRSDLVTNKMCQMECCSGNPDDTFPLFNNERALIWELKNGIEHYGYIDKKGTTVIPTNFLRATPFTKNGAIVVRLYKEVLGENEVLDKRMLSYSYNQELIDVNGNVTVHLNGPTHLTYSKERVEQLEELPVKFLSDTLMAVKINAQWELRKLNYE